MPSTLAERLDRIRAGAAERIPEDARRVMRRATEELERSGRAESAIGDGDPAPAFALPDARGGSIGLATLLGEGPVVLTFFRGFW